MFAKTPNPPYYAVVFSTLKSGCNDGYEAMAKKMTALASKQAGFLGLESAKNELGITISYWRDLKSIQAWKENAEHMEAQEKGKSLWYKEFKLRIAKVENDYHFKRNV